MSVNEKMTAIADASRGKTGKTDSLTLDQMATAISGIQVGTGAVVHPLNLESLLLEIQVPSTFLSHPAKAIF